MLETVLTVIFILLFIKAALIAQAYFWQWLYSSATGQDETHFIGTEDGRRLALHRYRPDSLGQDAPVILCHGAGANRYSFDLPGAPSLAEFLRQEGRDVWVCELRGSGMSDRPGLFHSDAPYRWDFEDHLRKDVPAVIKGVLQRTGAAAAHWVGHSMGGMLIQAHLATSRDGSVVSAVTVGAPADFTKMDRLPFRIMLKMEWIFKLNPFFPVPILARIITPLAQQAAALLPAAFHAPNVTPETARRVMALSSQLLTSSKLWLNFARFLRSGIYGPGDGTEYLAGLAACDVPVLILGGSRDQMAPEGAVCAPAVVNSDSGERKCVILGRAAGCVEDYGHMDLMVGKRAAEEVYPLILQWLDDHEAGVTAK
jgi:pimeloyl-ACP methyl ester carboxylesterase